MLLRLGWREDEGLGKTGQGRREPVEAHSPQGQVKGKAGLGYCPALVTDQLAKEVEAVIVEHLGQGEIQDLVFDSGFSKEENKVVKIVAGKYQLQSKSVKMGNKEYLVLSSAVSLDSIVEELVRGGQGSRVWVQRALYTLKNQPSLGSPEPRLQYQDKLKAGEGKVEDTGRQWRRRAGVYSDTSDYNYGHYSKVKKVCSLVKKELDGVPSAYNHNKSLEIKRERNRARVKAGVASPVPQQKVEVTGRKGLVKPVHKHSWSSYPPEGERCSLAEELRDRREWALASYWAGQQGQEELEQLLRRGKSWPR